MCKTTEECKGPVAVFALFLTVLAGALYERVRPSIGVPASIFMIAFGAIIGAIAVADTHWAGSLVLVDFSPDLILHVFLPVLIFDSGQALKLKVLSRVTWSAVMLAGPGVLFGAFSVAGLGLSMYNGWSFLQCLLLGSVVAATDPVAVVATLHDLDADPFISTLTDSEALMNDGAAIALFAIVEKMISATGTVSVGDVIANVFRFTCMPIPLGIGFGFVMHFISQNSLTNPTVIGGVQISLAYITFYVSDVLCHTSGVLTLLIAGIFIARQRGRHPKGQAEDNVVAVWGWLVFVGNTLIFAVVGFLVVVKSASQDWSPVGGFGTQVGYGVLLFLFLNALRFVMVFWAWPFIDCFAQLPSDRMTWQRFIFLSAGGLRGGIAIVLGMFVLNSHELDHDKTSKTFGATFFLQVAVVVILSSVINGQLSGPLVRLLKLNSKEVFSFFSMRMAVQELKNASISTLDNMKHAGRASQQMVSWLFVRAMSVHKLEELTLEIEHEAKKMATMSKEQQEQRAALVNKSGGAGGAGGKDGEVDPASPGTMHKRHIQHAIVATPHGTPADPNSATHKREPFAVAAEHHELDQTMTTADQSYHATNILKQQHLENAEDHKKRHRHHHHHHKGMHCTGCCACCSDSGSSSSGSSSSSSGSDDDEEDKKKNNNEPQEMTQVENPDAPAGETANAEAVAAFAAGNNNTTPIADSNSPSKKGGKKSKNDASSPVNKTLAAIAAIVAEHENSGGDDDDDHDGDQQQQDGAEDDDDGEMTEEDIIKKSKSNIIESALVDSESDGSEEDGTAQETENLAEECKALRGEASAIFNIAKLHKERGARDKAKKLGAAGAGAGAGGRRGSVGTDGGSDNDDDEPSASGAEEEEGGGGGALQHSRSAIVKRSGDALPGAAAGRRAPGTRAPGTRAAAAAAGHRRSNSDGAAAGAGAGASGSAPGRGRSTSPGARSDGGASSTSSLQHSRSAADMTKFGRARQRQQTQRSNSSIIRRRTTSRREAIAAAAQALADKALRVRDLLNNSTERHIMAPVILKMIKRCLWLEYNNGLIHGTTAVVFSAFIDGRTQSQEPVFCAKDVLDYARGDTHLTIIDQLERWLLPDYFNEHYTTLLVEVSVVFVGMMQQVTKELPLMAKQHANLIAWQTWSRFVLMEAQAFEKHMQLKHPTTMAHILSRRAAQTVLAKARESVSAVAVAFGLSTHQKKHLHDKLFDYAFESLTSSETHSIAHEIESGGNAALKLHLVDLLRNTHIFYSASDEILDMIVQEHEVVELEREGDAMWLEDSVGLVVVGALSRMDALTGKRVRIFRSGDIFGVNAFVTEQAEPKQFVSLGNGFDEDDDDEVHNDFYDKMQIAADGGGAAVAIEDEAEPLPTVAEKINRNKVEVVTIKYALLEKIMSLDSRVRHHVLMASAFDRLMPVLDRSYPFSALTGQQRRGVVVQGHVSRVHSDPARNNSAAICAKFHGRDSLFLLRGGATDAKTGAKVHAPHVLMLPEKFNGTFEPGSIVIQLPDSRLTSQRVLLTGMTFVDTAHLALDVAFTSFAETAAQTDALKALDQLLHELHKYTHICAVIMKLTKSFVPPPSAAPSPTKGGGTTPSGRSPALGATAAPAASSSHQHHHLSPIKLDGTSDNNENSSNSPLIDTDAILRVRDCVTELMRHLRIWDFHRHSGRLNRLYVSHALSAYFDLVVRRADEWAPAVKLHFEKAQPTGFDISSMWNNIDAVLTPADSFEFMTSMGFLSEGDFHSIMGWERLSVDFEVPKDLHDTVDEPSPVLVSATLPDADCRLAVFHAKARGKMVAAAMRDLPTSTGQLLQQQRLFARARVQVSRGKSLPSGTSGHDVVAPMAQTSRSEDDNGPDGKGSASDMASELGQVCTELAREAFAPPQLGTA